MKLKKIELQGFKSFADKTEISFLDGVTTIVGPNGSGKSNISDALRWVLGEQSVKTLRGSKMEDVIFAGTQVRKKLGFAEVSMYIDNSDMELPVEYKEVVVTRRVYRSGESNYLINNNECRLKDIQELFMDTGIGKDGYSIISQGKIDEILSNKSEERRGIFEEASGIVKYRTRKEEATRKLNNTETSLARVSDVLNEIENVIEPLEKKAETAKKYLSLRDELKNYDVMLFINSAENNNKDIEKLDSTIDAFENDILTENKNYNELEEKKELLKERVNEILTKVEENQNKFYDIQSETEKLNSKIELTKSQIENNNQNITRMVEEIKQDSSKIDLLKEELLKKDEKRISMSNNKKKFEDDLNEKQEELNKILTTLDEKGLEIESVKTSIEDATDKKYEYKVEISSLVSKIEANENKLDEKKKQDEKSLTQKDSLNAHKSDVYLELSKCKQELEKVEKEISDLNLDKENFSKEIEEKSKLEEKLKQELMSLSSKYNYLTNLDKEMEGYYKSVKEALEYSSKNSKVYGTLASLISTDEKYEYAIEIALGTYIQNIVVESENEAKEIIEYLKQNLLGRATFLPLSNLKQVKCDFKNKLEKKQGYIGLASELVKFDKKYQKAIDLSLGTTAIVDSIENAIKIFKEMKGTVRIVTLSGELIAATGSMTGGKNTAKSTGLIGRKEKISKLKESIALKEKECEDYTRSLQKIREDLVGIKEKLTLNWDKKDKINITLATLNEKYNGVLKEIEKIENSKEALKDLINEITLENESLNESVNKLNEQIEKIDEENAKNQEIVDEYARFNKEKQQEIDFLNEDIVNLKISLSSFDESVASIDEMKEKITQDISNFEFGIDRKNEQIESLKNGIIELNDNILKLEEDINSKDEFRNEYQKINENLKIEKEDLTKKQEEIDKSLIDSIKKVEKLKDEKSKVESKKIKYDIELENLKAKMWDEYELTISSAKKFLEGIEIEKQDISKLQKKSEQIRKSIKDLGEVNVGAIDEYNDTKTRYDFISNQKKDLEETKSKLNNLISNMTSIMKTQFAKQFKVIAENFNETFKELFGGGKADLKLSDEGNVLESGIEIEVQPPGKKLQSMMLLSGGEKALTATALLFAILKIKSPPFCILDEIEAALDDVNVHRFAEYIKKYSSATQFIVITHRKGTMEIASSVYGVTMQEYGISKVVSMKLKN